MEVLCRLSYSGARRDRRRRARGGHDIERSSACDHVWMRRLLSLMMLAVPLAGCSGDPPELPSPPDAEASVVIRTADGPVELDVELADTDRERATGLMGRERIGPYDGMAFIFGAPTEGTFWMKNTLIPLSIAFWDETGRIVRILDMEPCEADPCPTYGPGEPYVAALEVEQGAFEDHGVEVGDRVELITSEA
jgi:uncharacterized membrane protein (UPF0127 family)